MNFIENAQKTFLPYLERLGLAWWIKIVTENPRCIYYFGPFASIQQAKLHEVGYMEDLKQEKAHLLSLEIKQGKPRHLTIDQPEVPDKFETSFLKNIYEAFIDLRH